MPEIKSDNIAVIGIKDGVIIFFKTFDHDTQKNDATEVFEFVMENYDTGYITTLGNWELENKYGQTFYSFNLPHP